jgi:hypothetical protein
MAPPVSSAGAAATVSDCAGGASRGDGMNKQASAAAVFLLCAGTAHGADKEKEPSAILEIGGAGEWSLQNGGAGLGPSVAVEVEPIKEWLEIEAGFTPLFSKGNSPEWSTDLLFKKPFTLSKTVEFMVGAGPEWTYTERGNAGGGRQRGFAASYPVIVAAEAGAHPSGMPPLTPGSIPIVCCN